jgi:ssDNA-specific exonuclease RecJ
MFLDHFDALMSKIFFKKKYYFDTFPNKKHFEKQPQLHFNPVCENLF